MLFHGCTGSSQPVQLKYKATGASPEVLAVYEAWFGEPKHMSVGYSSHDTEVIRTQIRKAKAMGISGFVVDWYGDREPFIDQSYALMQALAALLINAKSVEVVSTNPNDLAQFGLNHPSGQLIIKNRDRKPINIYFGSENPTGTAIYARIEGIPKVFLLGKNLEYYQTLMIQWVEGKQGKNA